MEILYRIFIGMIVGMIVGMIDGIGLQCRRDRY
jgi:TctA family transporter